MRVDVLAKLRTPGGSAPLQIAAIAQQAGDDIITGTVIAPAQGTFAIRNGILDLLPKGVGPLSPAQRSNFLSPVARFYERPWRSNTLSWFSGEPLAFRREQAIFELMLPTERTGLWLDLAASTALYARWLAPSLRGTGGELISLDFSLPMLQQARRQGLREGHSNISFVAARGETLPFATGTVAGVVCGGSLNEFGAKGAITVLREVARVLESGGTALFMHLLQAENFVGTALQKGLAQPGGVHFWGRGESNLMFGAAGLAVEECRDFGIVAFTRLRKANEIEQK